MRNLSRLQIALALGTVCFSSSWAFLAACTSDTTTPEATEPAPFCPNTVKLAQGAACTQEGFMCPIGYPCGAFLAEQAQCTCTMGKYACVDSKGTAIDPDNPVCVSAGGGNAKECPASETSADNASCKTPGLQCHYAGPTCPGAASANIDTCQCVGANKDGGVLQFACEPMGCNPQSDASIIPPVDAGDAG
ncbi:MAG: hypothetical protein ABIP39_09805 [Polyangiaceae bacterium]